MKLALHERRGFAEAVWLTPIEPHGRKNLPYQKFLLRASTRMPSPRIQRPIKRRKHEYSAIPLGSLAGRMLERILRSIGDARYLERLLARRPCGSCQVYLAYSWFPARMQ